jgi:hypothetical protein
MSIDRVGNRVGLVTRIQPEGDLENSWIMLNLVKKIVGWTTMACHVYDPSYCGPRMYMFVPLESIA